MSSMPNELDAILINKLINIKEKIFKNLYDTHKNLYF